MLAVAATIGRVGFRHQPNPAGLELHSPSPGRVPAQRPGQGGAGRGGRRGPLHQPVPLGAGLPARRHDGAALRLRGQRRDGRVQPQLLPADPGGSVHWGGVTAAGPAGPAATNFGTDCDLGSRD